MARPDVSHSQENHQGRFNASAILNVHGPVHNDVLTTISARVATLLFSIKPDYPTILSIRRPVMPMPQLLTSTATQRTPNGQTLYAHKTACSTKHENKVAGLAPSEDVSGFWTPPWHVHSAAVERYAVDYPSAQGTTADGMALDKNRLSEHHGVRTFYFSRLTRFVYSGSRKG